MSKDEPNIRRKEDDRTRVIAVAAVIFVVLVVLLFSRMSGNAPEKRGGPAVSATIFPVYDIARNVAAPEIAVSVILPPGASPHTFEPSPSTLVALRDVDAVYAIGHGLDSWVDQLVDQSGGDMVIVDRGIVLRETAEEHDAHGEAGEEHEEEGQEHDAHGEEGGGHTHGGTDPHYWLDVLNAMAIARTISADLQERFPEAADETERRTQEYLSRLRGLHEELLARIGALEDRRVITLHDAWYYFAEAYGLEIVGTFEPSAGREPTPRYLAELQGVIDATGATRLFSEPQIITESLSAFIRDNDLSVATLDPIGGVPGRESYVELLRYDAAVIAGDR